MWPEANELAHLDISFLICKMGMVFSLLREVLLEPWSKGVTCAECGYALCELQLCCFLSISCELSTLHLIFYFGSNEIFFHVKLFSNPSFVFPAKQLSPTVITTWLRILTLLFSYVTCCWFLLHTWTLV